jgi:elongation factor Ts
MSIKIAAALVKELRESSGAGMMDCKKALMETEGDMEKAKEFLRKKGLAAAAKKSGRIAAEGIVDSYIHANGKIGVLVEVNCETDFAARTDAFKEFVHNVSLQIAAYHPRFISADEIPEEETAKETEIFIAQLKEQGKPDNIIEKIVPGKIVKWHKEVCLLNQEFAFNEEGKKDMEELNKEITATIGEKVTIRRFIRWEMGEGLTKRVYDLAAEVEAEMNK